MMYLFELLLRYPACARILGAGMFSIAAGAIALGWRLGRRLGRAERVLSPGGSEQTWTLDQVLPASISWAIPESPLGFATWFFAGAAGTVLALAAKKIQRVYH
jgi:hypothetical protein